MKLKKLPQQNRLRGQTFANIRPNINYVEYANYEGNK